MVDVQLPTMAWSDRSTPGSRHTELEADQAILLERLKMSSRAETPPRATVADIMEQLLYPDAVVVPDLGHDQRRKIKPASVFSDPSSRRKSGHASETMRKSRSTSA